MNYFCNPLNIEYKYQLVKHTRLGAQAAVRYREAADPSMVLFMGLYYLFPSMAAGFYTSENLSSWDFHKFLNDMPIYDYAPDVRVVGDYLYFSASKGNGICPFYRTKDPLTEPFEEIPGSFTFWDPNLFADDDGRLYFYWGCSNMTPIYGVELDKETMKPLSEPLVMFDSQTGIRGYERNGNDHIAPKSPEQVEADAQAMFAQIMSTPETARKGMGLASEEAVRHMANKIMGNDPYIEGAWLTKHNNRYYLQYAIPGTQYNVYSDGVYVAEAPLGPYHPAKNNPYSYKPGGFINGAGHGSTLEDKQGRYWHSSTMSISVNDDMERRLGLWKAGFDADGELFCEQRYGDWPIAVDAPVFAQPDFMLLSCGKPVTVSAGIGAAYITDENARTWWSGAAGDTVEVDLQNIFYVRAIQVNFADGKMEVDMEKGQGNVANYDQREIVQSNGKTRWLLEGSIDRKTYAILCDKSGAETDYPHDFVLMEKAAQVQFIRLTIINTPYHPACVSGLRVFGLGDGEKPLAIECFTAKKIGDMDMDVAWEAVNALGYNILWGYAPDKLYHSYMVFGQCEKRIGALVKDEPVYVRVDAFNEYGISEGRGQKLC